MSREPPEDHLLAHFYSLTDSVFTDTIAGRTAVPSPHSCYVQVRGLLGSPVSSRGHRAIWGWSLKQCCAYYPNGIKPYGNTEVLTPLDPVPYPEYLHEAKKAGTVGRIE